MKYYVFKLVPPRPSFLADMSAEERALMHAHGVYWRELLAKGMVIVFGPVADAAGPYGLAVVRLDETTEPSGVWGADPVILANRGFRFEVAPMLTAVHS